MKVRCYGCGQQYDVFNDQEQYRHTHHVGDSGLSREQLLRLLDEAQDNRDKLARRV